MVARTRWITGLQKQASCCLLQRGVIVRQVRAEYQKLRERAALLARVQQVVDELEPDGSAFSSLFSRPQTVQGILVIADGRRGILLRGLEPGQLQIHFRVL